MVQSDVSRPIRQGVCHKILRGAPSSIHLTDIANLASKSLWISSDFVSQLAAS